MPPGKVWALIGILVMIGGIAISVAIGQSAPFEVLVTGIVVLLVLVTVLVNAVTGRGSGCAGMGNRPTAPGAHNNETAVAASERSRPSVISGPSLPGSPQPIPLGARPAAGEWPASADSGSILFQPRACSQGPHPLGAAAANGRKAGRREVTADHEKVKRARELKTRGLKPPDIGKIIGSRRATVYGYPRHGILRRVANNWPESCLCDRRL